jgi:hypothetical protein
VPSSAGAGWDQAGQWQQQQQHTEEEKSIKRQKTEAEPLAHSKTADTRSDSQTAGRHTQEDNKDAKTKGAKDEDAGDASGEPERAGAGSASKAQVIRNSQA